MKKNLVIYHHPCADGITAAAIANTALGCVNTELLPWNYNKEQKFIDEHLESCKDRDVYILDFSFSKDLTDQIINLSNKTYWFDHHASAFENWLGKSVVPTDRFTASSNKFYIRLDNNKSGARITWDYFELYQDGSIPLLVQVVEDRDLWKFQLSCTKHISLALRSYDMDVEIWEEFLFKDRETAKLEQEGIIIERYQNKLLNNFNKHTILVEDDSIKCLGLVVNAPVSLASDLAELLFNLNHNANYCIVWQKSNIENGIFVSVRSRKNSQLTAKTIASKFGGSGHEHAAGFSINEFENIYSLFNINYDY